MTGIILLIAALIVALISLYNRSVKQMRAIHFLAEELDKQSDIIGMLGVKVMREELMEADPELFNEILKAETSA